jgi:hypothetical protein
MDSMVSRIFEACLNQQNIKNIPATRLIVKGYGRSRHFRFGAGYRWGGPPAVGSPDRLQMNMKPVNGYFFFKFL